MNEPLSALQHWFWISGALFVIYAALFVFKIRRRSVWLRWTTAESEFWKRLGAPRSLVDFIRRFGEGRISTICLGVITVLFALLTLLNAGAYQHFKHRFEMTNPQKAPKSATHR